MTARRPTQTIDYAGDEGTSVDTNWVGPAGPPYKAIAGLAVLLMAIVLVSSPALIGLLAIVDAQVLDGLLPWLGSVARLSTLLDVGRGLFVLVAAGLILTGRADA